VHFECLARFGLHPLPIDITYILLEQGWVPELAGVSANGFRHV
jgi:hypothetical protein